MSNYPDGMSRADLIHVGELSDPDSELWDEYLSYEEDFEEDEPHMSFEEWVEAHTCEMEPEEPEEDSYHYLDRIQDGWDYAN